MWSVVLKILSILGIILLCLLALALMTALLVLFWPIAYRGTGMARPGEYRACFRFRWFFGLVRGMYMYPEDGKLRIKVLWMTVYESGKDDKSGRISEEGSEEQHGTAMPEMQDLGKASPREKNTQEKNVQEQLLGQSTLQENHSQEITPQEQGLRQTSQQEMSLEERASREQKNEKPGQEQQKTDLKEKLLFYLGILQNKDNQELVRYGLGRLGRIIKHIRPRYLRVQAVAGLGEPDLTGYAYGVYWAVKPFLGKKCRMDIIPDFERRILEGEAALSGRLTVATILYHVCRVLFDRRLRQLLDQLK